MRVGVVTDFYYPWIGGPSRVVRSLAEGLQGRGHTVAICAPSPNGPPGAVRQDCIDIRRFLTVPVPFGYGVRMTVPAGLRTWLKEFQPDVVNVHHPFPLSAATILACGALGIPVVATNHTIPECILWGIRNSGPAYTVASAGFALWLKFLLGRCARVATPTQLAASRLVAMGYRRPITVISNGIDTARFQPGPPDAALAARLGLTAAPVVLYTGRLDAEKQMDVWIRAAAMVRDLDVQFVVGGEGTAKSSLIDLVQSLGMQDRVKFIGYLPEEDLPAVYRLSSLYFIMSPVELQSISTLEALASGLPVVGAEAGALPELVLNDHNGLLVPEGDAERAADALRRLIPMQQIRQVMGKRSREIALRHSIERTVDAYEALLTSVIMDPMGDVGREHATAAGR